MTLLKLPSKTNNKKEPDWDTTDPLDERNQETASPYGKYVGVTSEPFKLSLDGVIDVNLFEKGKLLTVTINDHTVFSKFISNK
jgi:hypothetical protein